MDEKKKISTKKTAQKHKKQCRLFQVAAIIFAIIGLFLLICGIRCMTLTGSWYYVIVSFGMFFTGFFLWKQDGFTYVLYSVILIISSLWSLREVGLRWWLLIPQLWIFFVVGLVFLFPYFRRGISKPRSVIFLLVSLLFIMVIAIVSLFFSSESSKGDIDSCIGHLIKYIIIDRR